MNEGDIMGPRKKVKENYEERMASIAKGREGRDKFGSAKGKKKEENHSSSTNKEKKRNKVSVSVMAVSVLCSLCVLTLSSLLHLFAAASHDGRPLEERRAQEEAVAPREAAEPPKAHREPEEDEALKAPTSSFSSPAVHAAPLVPPWSFVLLASLSAFPCFSLSAGRLSLFLTHYAHDTSDNHLET